LREEQKERQRKSGVDSSKLMTASQEALQKKEMEIEKELKGIQDQLAGPSLKTIMTNQFTEQIGLSQGDDKAHLKRMEAYIDEKMGVAKKDIQPTKILSEEDKLFLIKEDHSTKVDEGSTGVAAPLFMNTGLAEVSLPISFKMKNIERTEVAKAELGYKRSQNPKRQFQKTSEDEMAPFGGSSSLDAQPTTSGRYGGAAAITGGSFNSNFNTHRRERAATIKNDKRMGGGGDQSNNRFGGGREDGYGGGRNATSDDRCFDQYRKHQRR